MHVKVLPQWLTFQLFWNCFGHKINMLMLIFYYIDNAFSSVQIARHRKVIESTVT